MSEHYATDVPRATRIVRPEEHAGKLIERVRIDGMEAVYDTDAGEVRVHAHSRVEVQHGAERAARVAWARSVLESADG